MLHSQKSKVRHETTRHKNPVELPSIPAYRFSDWLLFLVLFRAEIIGSDNAGYFGSIRRENARQSSENERVRN